MTFQIGLAGQIIEVRSLYDKVYTWCQDYIIDPAKYSDTAIVIEVTEADIAKEDRTRQFNAWKKHPDSIMVYHPAHLEVFVVCRKICEIMPYYSAFLMHGAVVATDHAGYMFTAPSGTGKTTRAKIWQSVFPGSVIVNGDKPLIRVDTDSVEAWGTPWAGKESENTNMSVPLRAILLLERAENQADNEIKQISFSEAFPSVYNQIYHPADQNALRETLKLIQRLEGKTMFYRLRCTPTSEAIRMA